MHMNHASLSLQHDFLLKIKYSHARCLGFQVSFRFFPRFLVVLMYLLDTLEYEKNVTAGINMHAGTF